MDVCSKVDTKNDAILFKGIVSDSNNIILWHESQDLN